MPDLIQSLQGHDLGHLRIVAELWGVELEASEARAVLRQVVAKLLDRSLVEEVVEDLPSPAQAALDDLLGNGGALPWPLFTRRYGTVREIGPGRRDRERPFLHPASPAEVLWYRALVARAFQDTPKGPEEIAYIPDDLRDLLPSTQRPGPRPFGRPSTPAERAHPVPASDRVLDHACTLLAALRLGLPLPDAYPLPPANARTDHSIPVREDWHRVAEAIPANALCELLRAGGLLDEHGLPQAEPVRAFLEAPRGEALAHLAHSWLNSEDFDELRLLPGVCKEGEWQSHPLQARRAVLDFLLPVPPGSWWSLPAFVAAVRKEQPDFQRPAGDYDSWFLRDQASGEFLRGFEHWEAVDGAIIRYIICGPLHWLGILELAAPAAGKLPAAFRYSAWASALLRGEAPQGLVPEEAPVVARSDARLSVPWLTPRAVRYQIARFSSWEGEKGESYLYRLTPASLERAHRQGLRLNHLLALLRRVVPDIPPSLARALERWEQHGTEARLERLLVLRLRNPELLQTLRSSRAARFLGEPLGPAAVTVKPGAWEKVLAALAEMGYLGEIVDEK